jgi:hypothetical protein
MKQGEENKLCGQKNASGYYGAKPQYSLAINDNATKCLSRV